MHNAAVFELNSDSLMAEFHQKPAKDAHLVVAMNDWWQLLRCQVVLVDNIFLCRPSETVCVKINKLASLRAPLLSRSRRARWCRGERTRRRHRSRAEASEEKTRKQTAAPFFLLCGFALRDKRKATEQGGENSLPPTRASSCYSQMRLDPPDTSKSQQVM